MFRINEYDYLVPLDELKFQLKKYRKYVSDKAANKKDDFASHLDQRAKGAEIDFQRLAERFKDDQEKLKSVYQDWYDYNYYIWNELANRDIYVAMGDVDMDEVTKMRIKAEEIVNRISSLLNSESALVEIITSYRNSKK